MTGEDLKELRNKKGWTQDELASLAGVTKRSIINYEKSAIIPKSKANTFHFIFLDTYTDKELALDKLTVKEPLGYIKTKNGLTYEELPNGKFQVIVPKVPYKAYASFIEVYGDEYATKESFGTAYFTVEHPGKGNYVAFTVGNDSMNGGGINDTPNGAEVLGRELQRHHWKDGFNSTDYGWIIICETGMFHKDIEGPSNEGMITCQSRNPSLEYPDFEMSLNEVHTIWKVIKRSF